MAVRKIETEISLSGEKEFNDQMKSVNNNLKSTGAELNAVSAAMSNEGASAELLTKKQKLLDEQVEQQREKLRALNQMHQKAVEAQGEDSAAADKYRQAVAQAQAALSKMEKAQKENAETLKESTDAAKKAESPIRKLSAAKEDLKEKIESAKKENELLLKSLSKTAEGANTAVKGTAKLAGGLTAVGGAISGAFAVSTLAVIKGLGEAAIEAAESGDPAFASLAGNLERLKSASASAKGSIASVLLPSLESLSKEGASWLTAFSVDMNHAAGDSQAMSAVMSKYIKSGVEMLRSELPQLLESGEELIMAVTEGAIENLPEVMGMAEEIVSVLLDGVEENADMLAEGAVTLITGLSTYLLSNAPELLPIGVQVLTTFITGLAGAMPEILPVALQAVLTLATALITEAPKLLEAGLELILSIVTGIVDGLPNIYAQAPALIEELKNGIANAAESLINIGGDIVSKIFQGIKDAWHTVAGWFENESANLRGGVVGALPGAATGMNYVPYDDYAVRLHEGEMVVPKRLATQLRAAGINKDSDLSGGIGGGGSVTTNIYTSQLTQAQIDYIIDLIDRRLGE